jgi:hypothetical protein
MKTLHITVLVGLIAISSFSAQVAYAETKNEFGLGVILGQPSGVNAQFFWGPTSSVDVTAAWSFRGNGWFMTMADFQIYNYLGDAPREWKWYYGLGGYLALPQNEDGILGLRIPLGIKYNIPHSPVDVWGEVAPALQVIPNTEAEFQGGLGATLWLR